LQSSTPAGAAFVHEVKLDGYRLQPHIRNGKVTLYTRRRLDWTHRFGRTLAATLAQLLVKTAIVDGEVIVEGKGGLPSFSALQDALSIGGKGQYVFYAFDLLYLDGRDLRELPLIERKAALAKLIPAPDVVRYSEHFEDGAGLFRQACAIGLEGIISKKRSAPYRSGRGKDWLKVKCSTRQEFVAAGFVPSKAHARAIGSLVLGYYEGGKLMHAGRVGTGYTERVAPAIPAEAERASWMRSLVPSTAGSDPRLGEEAELGRGRAEATPPITPRTPCRCSLLHWRKFLRSGSAP
jgi:bifunctional non-homologous end joining protein LigD